MKEQLKLTRHNLSLLDSFDLEEEMTEQERRTYNTEISQVLPLLEKDIVRAVYDQMVTTMSTADDMDKVTLGQGAINGMNILLEKWKRAAAELEENIEKGKEEVDEHNPLPQV